MNKTILLPIATILIASALIPYIQQTDASTIVTFSDQATFLAATGATCASCPMPDLGFGVPAGTPVVVNAVTFTSVSPSGNLFIGGTGVGVPNNDWTSLIAGNDIAISGPSNLDVGLTAPVFSFGFQFHEPTCNNTNTGNNCGLGVLGQVEIGTAVTTGNEVDSTFTVTLKNGVNTVASFQFNAPDDVASFVGVQSDMSFDKVEIRETVGGDEDEHFGEFFTGTVPIELISEQQRAVDKANKAVEDACTKIQREIDRLNQKGISIPQELQDVFDFHCT